MTTYKERRNIADPRYVKAVEDMADMLGEDYQTSKGNVVAYLTEYVNDVMEWTGFGRDFTVEER